MSRPLPENIASPCIRNCCLDERDICMGCFRSLVEITGWHCMSESERLAALELARRRRCMQEIRRAGGFRGSVVFEPRALKLSLRAPGS